MSVQWPRERPGRGHLLHVGDEAGGQDQTIAAWLRRGLADGGRVLLPDAGGAVPTSVLSQDLRAGGGGVADDAAAGRVTVLPADMFYVPLQLRQWVDRCLEVPPLVYLLPSVASALTVLSSAQYFLFDEALDTLCEIPGVAALCRYDPYHDVLEIDDVVGQHAAAVIAGDLRVTTHEGGVVTLAGSIDLLAEATLSAVLGTATREPVAVLTVDLTAVTFLSAGGCRVLATATSQFRAAGGYVLLVTPSPAIERVLRLADLDRLRGFEILP